VTAQNELKDVRQYFDATADEFGALYEGGNTWRARWNRLVRKALYERARLTLLELSRSGVATVLDVGSGTGRNALLFAAACPGEVVGIDISQEMIDRAREAAKASPVGNRCRFELADVMTYDSTAQVDGVVALGLFDYVRDAEPALAKMVAIARRRVMASFPATSLLRAPLRKLRYALRGCPVYFYTRGEVEAMARSAGLKRIDLVPLGDAGFLLIGYKDNG
jgi:ubiquinone/menaquinone biosynthesis C-methylase UbiE